MFFASGIVSRAWTAAVLLLMAVTGAAAQCPTANPDPRLLPRYPVQASEAQAEPMLPEAGLLSNTHYTSQYFGFSFELPLTVQGHEIMMPVMPEKQHALLALQFEQGEQRGSIMITATDPPPGFDGKTPESIQREVDSWAHPGPQAGGLPQASISVPDYLLRSNHFRHRVTRRGRNYTAEYTTDIDNYSLRILVATNDEHFLHKAKDALSDAQFYCANDGTLTDDHGEPVKVPGRPYAGPTVPTFLVNAALRDQPEKKIAPGEVADGVYRNPELGLRYALPAGWAPIASGPVDPPLEATALREYRFLHSCSQILLQAAPRDPAADDRSAITLRALDPDCLAMRTAASLTDKRGVDEVAASLEELREFGEIGSDQLMSDSGHLFMIFHGTIAAAPRGAELAARLSQTIFATRYNKLLLVWTYMAANTTALQQLPTGTIVLGDSPGIHPQIDKHDVAR